MSSPGAGSAETAGAQAERDAAWNEVKTALQSSVARAAFTTSDGGVAKLHTPLIYVQGRDEPIPLPVDADTAAALVALPACVPAPFGRGTETVLDSSYRACHQVDASAVTIRGRGTEWEDGLRALVTRVCKSFELPATKVVSTPYKLLLYGPGGHFKAHRDTEKADHMFGTLIVQFPSNHDGGALVVRHGGSEVVHSFGAAAAGSAADAGTSAALFSCHFAAHYADLEHELTEVTRGYRLAMVYLLSYTGEAASTPTVFAGTSQLAARLAAPLELAMRPPAVLPTGDGRFECDAGFKLIRLSHDYTLRSLRESGAAALKDRDAAVWAALRAANTEAAVPCALLLARFQWSTEHVGYTVYDDEKHDLADRGIEEYTIEYVDASGGVDSTEAAGAISLYDASGLEITNQSSKSHPTSAQAATTTEPPICTVCQLKGVLCAIRDNTHRDLEVESAYWSILGDTIDGGDHVCPAPVSAADSYPRRGGTRARTPRAVLPVFSDDFWLETVDASRACAMGNEQASYDLLYDATAIMLIATEHPQFASIKEALAKAAALSVNARPESSSKTGAEGAAGGAGGSGAASEGTEASAETATGGAGTSDN